MLHFERMSAIAGLAKNVTKSNLVLPRACVTRIFIGFGDHAARDKTTAIGEKLARLDVVFG
jgi:hypothetical protein